MDLMNDPETMVRGWALALRDLCEQGAVRVTARFEDGSQIVYRLGEGAQVTAAGHVLNIPESALDDIGLEAVTEEEFVLARAPGGAL